MSTYYDDYLASGLSESEYWKTRIRETELNKQRRKRAAFCVNIAIILLSMSVSGVLLLVGLI